jgi:hypothetical protein
MTRFEVAVPVMAWPGRGRSSSSAARRMEAAAAKDRQPAG